MHILTLCMFRNGIVGFWISTNWLGNAKKYMEALQLPELDAKRKTGAKKKQSRIRARRGSDSLPPWPAINSEIVCEHGSLCIAGRGVKGRRRAIESRYWHFLRRFYPEGPQFKCARCSECELCKSYSADAKATAAEKRDATITTRRNDFVPPILTALLLRKCGVPLNCVTSRVAYFMEGGETPEQAQQNRGLQQLSSSSRLNQLAAAVEEEGAEQTPVGIHGSPSHNSLSIYLSDCAAFKSVGFISDSCPSPRSAALISSCLGADEVATPLRSPIPKEYAMIETPVTNACSAARRSPLPNHDQHIGKDDGLEEISYRQMFADSIGVGAEAAAEDSPAPTFTQPLIAGHYNVVPRKWLKAWRRYMKDPSVTTLPMLNCSSLLCAEHRQIVIPPHLLEYLLNMRRTLLSGLGLYEGEIVEILSADEWDALQSALPCQTVADRSIRFCLDGENIFWNMGVCSSCDPFNLDPMSKKTKTKSSRNSQSSPPDLLIDGSDAIYC